MKIKIFTPLVAALLLGSWVSNAQDNGTGVNWDEFTPSSPLVLDENFQGFEFFHTDADPNSGNSEHKLDEDGETIIWGYKELETDVPLLNGNGALAHYSFYQCAFAPEWKTSYGYRDLVATGTGNNTDNVTDGFVEISRFDTVYSQIHTLAGHLVVDLRNIEYVEMIQWTHSSTGGKRRGVLCEISLDDGASWDTLRFQPGEAYLYSFTRDPFTGEDTPNAYRCEPSGYGMTWADGVYAENVMLRFSSSGIPTIQTARIHDLKVYGDLPTSVDGIETNALKVFARNKEIIFSEYSDIQVYNLSGVMVRNVSNTNRVDMNEFPSGVYFVKASNASRQTTHKILVK